MRELTSHKVNECNEQLKVIALDDPGNGGAHHKYTIEYPQQRDGGAGLLDSEDGVFKNACILNFQDGPIKEVGVNGITEQALIAVLLDRLRGFQSGPYSCRENAVALTKLEECEMWMHQRTRNRQARGVEGTHKI